jgi:hypothetical protein
VSNGDDQQEQLSPLPSRSEFLSGLRKRAPQLADIPDDTLWQGIVKRRPEIEGRIRPEEVPDPFKQAHAVSQRPFESTVTDLKGTELKSTGIPKYVGFGDPVTGEVGTKEAATAASMVGGALGGATVAAGRGVLPAVMRALGTGMGATMGNVAVTRDPKQALKTGGEFAGFSLGTEGIGKLFGTAGKALRKFWSVDPERFASLTDLAETEEKTRMAVQAKAPEARQQVNDSYPKVTKLVRIMPPGKVAAKAEGEMVAETAPKQVSKIAEMGRERQRAALRVFSKVMPALNRLAEDESNQADIDSVKASLKKLRSLQGISFRDAQKLYSSLGRALAKGEGWKLPGETYNALRESRDVLEDMMREAARSESHINFTAKGLGVMPEEPTHVEGYKTFQDSQTGGHFYVSEEELNPQTLTQKAREHRSGIGSPAQLSDVAQGTRIPQVQRRFNAWQPQDMEKQWEQAQAAHKQMIDDFYRADGPLTKIMKAKPDERGEVLSHLLRDPKTRVRATEAMERWGINTSDIHRLAQKWRDPVALHRAIEDTARMEQLGARAFGVQEVEAYRKKVGIKALQWGAGASALGGGGYKLWKMLQERGPSINR